jgi:cob(I)alamin adenosyltransferase
MVTLSKIYTRTGDDGSTMLGNGERIHKTDPRVRAYGTVDELSSVIGMTHTVELPGEIGTMLTAIQNDLFDIGSDLCTPISEAEQAGKETRKNRVPEQSEKKLEDMIDLLQKDLKPLQSFVLPGGSPASAWLHMARTVCRRAELEALKLSEVAATNAATIVYLNRLSDLFFVMARWANRENGEILWVPGGK